MVSKRLRPIARAASDSEAPRDMRHLWMRLTFALVATFISVSAAEARSRIKDIVSFEGVRSNELVGYGLSEYLDQIVDGEPNGKKGGY